jgi:hypothetical protein
MILYTTMPQEFIYPIEQQESNRQMLIQFDGIPLLVEQTTDNCYQVLRVMSSDPSHYLDNRCYPGAKISLFN